MDLVGHLTVIEEAGLGKERFLSEEEIIFAMFPNFAHCHEWAYKTLWNVHQKASDRDLRLIQGHMICDWVIHYGPRWTPVMERVGWAYHEMPLAVAELDPFMDKLVSEGHVECDPRSQDSRDHLERDFGHTTIECALDFILANKYVGTDRLQKLAIAFERLALPEESLSRIQKTFEKVSGYTREPRSRLLKTINEYARWSTYVTHPEQYAALTLMSKYNIKETPETLEFVVGFLKKISGLLDSGGLWQTYDQIVERIANPELAMSPFGAPARSAGRRDDLS